MTSVPAASVKPARSKLMTQQKIDRRIKSGRGSGVKESYEPWIKVWDIKSKGVSHLVSGVKVYSPGKGEKILINYRSHMVKSVYAISVRNDHASKTASDFWPTF